MVVNLIILQYKRCKSNRERNLNTNISYYNQNITDINPIFEIKENAIEMFFLF